MELSELDGVGKAWVGWFQFLYLAYNVSAQRCTVNKLRDLLNTIAVWCRIDRIEVGDGEIIHRDGEWKWSGSLFSWTLPEGRRFKSERDLWFDPSICAPSFIITTLNVWLRSFSTSDLERLASILWSHWATRGKGGNKRETRSDETILKFWDGLPVGRDHLFNDGLLTALVGGRHVVYEKFICGGNAVSFPGFPAILGVDSNFSLRARHLYSISEIMPTNALHSSRPVRKKTSQ